MKKFVSILCILILFVAQIGFLAEVAPIKAEASNVIEFSCGLNVTGYLDKDAKTLTIYGTGDMNYFAEDYPPWMSYCNYINYVIIENGVTSIEDFAFFRCNLQKIVIPESIEYIGSYAISMGDVVEIEIAENSRLQEFIIDDYFHETTWYKNQPDGPVYLGRMLLDYKGTMPSNTVLEVREGTYAINREAFYDQNNLTDIIVPESVERIGIYAFLLTGLLNNKPEGEVYLGNILYAYNTEGAIKEEDYKDELRIPEGIVSVADGAFIGRCVYSTVVFPSSLEYIGEEAFLQCSRLENIVFEENSSLNHIDRFAFQECRNLKSPDFPDGLKRIDYSVFYQCDSIDVVNIPASVEFIGFDAFDSCDNLTEICVHTDNAFYCSDEYGVLYSKDKTVLVRSPINIKTKEYSAAETVVEILPSAFSESTLEKIDLPETVHTIGFCAFTQSNIITINLSYGLKYIEAYTFYNCENLTDIVIPKSVVSIGDAAFMGCENFKRIVIPPQVSYISDNAFNICRKLEINCYKDTTAYFYCVENDIPYILLEHPNTDELYALIDKYRALDRDKYFYDSIAELDNAVSLVNMNANEVDQALVDEWTNNIREAFSSLEYLPADYYVVNIALERAEAIDRSQYTDDSLAKLDESLAAVKTDIDISNQDIVIEYARAINEAIDNLEYLPANYTKVEDAISESHELDRRLYSQATLAVLDQSISAVEYGLNITEQAKVDGFAEQISNAISALEYADVVLRNEPHGVIVSATAKEIDPDTALTVDLKDSSDLQNGNFAVGGTVKSITLYDINLLLNAQKTQPDGFVTVKIKLPDGVDPKRCKVYHVIDDPVDPLVRYTTALEGNFIVFETDHFSEFAVIEVETVLNSIEITKLPNKTVYALGETVNTSGLEVTAHYSDGSAKIVSEYDVSSVDTLSIGKKTITVYHTYNGITKSDSFEITVNGDKIAANITLNGEDINEYNKKVAWYKGYSSESVKLDCATAGNYKVEWSSDNSKVLVDSNGNVTNKGFFFARKATITVKVTDSAGNVLATDSIIVRFYKLSFQLSSIQSTIVQAFKKSGLIF